MSFDCLSSVAPVDQTDVDQRWSRSEGPCQFRTIIEYRGRKRNAGHPRLDGSSFVLVAEDQPPSRIELARKRDGLSNHRHLRLPAHGHVLARSRKPDRARSEAARISIVRRLDELIKHGYVERVGNDVSRHEQGEHP